MTGTARIPPLTPAEMTEDQLRELGPWKDLIFTQVMLRHPDMYGKFLTFLRGVVPESILPPRDRQIVCLAMLQLCGDTYEKTHHIEISRKVGLSQAEIDAVLAGGGEALDDWDRTVMQATKELYADQFITDATWAKLGDHYSQQQLMEIVFLAGCYKTMAMLTKSFGIQLEPDLEEFNKHRDYAD